MDGYAVRFADMQRQEADQPVQLEVVEEIPAGYLPQQTIQPGQCARIFTGSMMPQGADTIVIQEHTQRQETHVFILETPDYQAYVRRQGEFCRAGDVILPAGIKLTAPDLAVLAAAQCTEVKVYRHPRVALLSTGSELVSLDQPLQPGQIVDSNQIALAALVAQTGAIPLRLGIVPDQPAALKVAMSDAIAQADVVISSGGVSVGDYDYVDQILAELGAKIHIRAIAIKPGKPLTVAIVPRADQPDRPVLYFGLPGNPVSALVTFWRFVQPALKKLSGLRQGWEPQFVTALTRHRLKSDGKRETYLWGQLHLLNGQYEFDLAGGSHSSGNLINLAQTNALAVLPVGQTSVSEGTLVQVLQVTS
jgi:molybdopterin molybdotransferase